MNMNTGLETLRERLVMIEGAGHDYRRSTDLIEQVNGCIIDFLTINNLV